MGHPQSRNERVSLGITDCAAPQPSGTFGASAPEHSPGQCQVPDVQVGQFTGRLNTAARLHIHRSISIDFEPIRTGDPILRNDGTVRLTKEHGAIIPGELEHDASGDPWPIGDETALHVHGYAAARDAPNAMGVTKEQGSTFSSCTTAVACQCCTSPMRSRSQQHPSPLH